MPRIKMIINAAAGDSRSARLAQDARSAFWGWDLEIEIPSSVAETLRHFAHLSPDVYAAVILCGGDGTLNQALASLVHNLVPLALFPGGTANDLAGELGMTADWQALRRLVEGGCTERIDLVRANDSYFATIGGIGIGSLLIASVNSLRANSRSFSAVWKLLKSQMYGLMTLRLILSGGIGLREVRIQAENFNRTLLISSLHVANQSSLGGGLVVAPKSRNDDGLLDFVVLALNHRIELFLSMAAAKSEISFPANHRFQAAKCTVESLDNQPLAVYGDGEILLSDVKIAFEVLPRSLLVFSTRNRNAITTKESLA